MKKNQRRFCMVGVLALAAALLILGCTFTIPEEAADDAPPPGTVWVNIPVPKVERQARSLNAAYSPAFVDYYEIYLRQRTDDGAGNIDPVDGDEKVYFGRAFEGEVLRVAVPPNYNYDALLLAGIERYKVLLASAFTNDPSGYDPSGDGIPIIPGQANTISFDLSSGYIASDPVTGYTFADNTLAPYSVTSGADEYDGLFMATLPAKGSLTSITATIVTQNISALAKADDTSATFPTFARETLSLKQYGTNHPVQTLVASAPGISGDGTDVTAEYTFALDAAHGNWPDPSTAAPTVQDRGVYARLDYTLDYYAFGRDGTDADVTSLWRIKNSYNPRYLDKGPNTGGSSILLIIGNDPGDFIPDETVEITW
jgi:hypothetical protein